LNQFYLIFINRVRMAQLVRYLYSLVTVTEHRSPQNHNHELSRLRRNVVRDFLMKYQI